MLGCAMSVLGQKQTCAAHKPMSARCQERTSDAAWILLRVSKKNPGFVCRGVWHLKPPRGRQFEYAPAKLSSFCLELRRLFHIFLGKEPNNHQSFRWISFRFKQCLKSIDVGLRDYIHDDLHAERFGLVQARARLRGLNRALQDHAACATGA